MDKLGFNYSQRFQPRVINDSGLERFIWDKFNFGTSYNEPFVQASLKNKGNQGYVFSQSVRPLRSIELEFSIMYFHPEDNDEICPSNLDFTKLQKFYLHHGCHQKFVFNHPIYGDMVVRFSKPIVMPKKNIGGSGTVQGFNLTLVEVVDTDYIFQKGENFEGELPLHAAYYDVEIDYVEDTLVAPLGGNYQMTFRKTQRPLRTLKINLEGMQYFFHREDGSLNLSDVGERNMALLEIFYLKHRLTEAFNFEYGGEIIKVRFKEPINISKVSSNTGVLGAIDLLLVETPYHQLEKEDLP